MTYFTYLNPIAPCIILLDENNNNNMIGIPLDPANTDYQQYLAWVAEGNTAEEWQPES